MSDSQFEQINDLIKDLRKKIRKDTEKLKVDKGVLQELKEIRKWISNDRT